MKIIKAILGIGLLSLLFYTMFFIQHDGCGLGLVLALIVVLSAGKGKRQ